MYPEDRVDEPTRKSSILPINSQDEIIAELQETVKHLYTRLEVVLTPTPESTVKNSDAKPLPAQSLLTEHLTRNNESLRIVIRKLGSIIERLEV